MQDDQTAARLDGNKRGFFTSDLSVSEFLLLHELGYTPLGLVMGTSIYQVGFQGVAWTESVELTSLTQAMYDARHLAMSRMTEEARYLGADGVVGMRLDIGGKHLGLDNNSLEFIAVGTAVKLPSNEPPSQQAPFTSDLSGQDLYKLHQSGFRPVSLVVGNCVYHVAYQANMPAMQARTNGENTVYTRAIYHARELAMDRMQAEAMTADAIGIVGVEVSEHSRNWDRHVFEFLAVGTSIRHTSGQKVVQAKSPLFAISLDD